LSADGKTVMATVDKGRTDAQIAESGRLISARLAHEGKCRSARSVVPERRRLLGAA
jgi:hypothetical protein